MSIEAKAAVQLQEVQGLNAAGDDFPRFNFLKLRDAELEYSDIESE